MTQDEIKTLHEIVRSGSWKLVDRVIDEHIQQLDSIGQIDLSLEPAQIKVQLEARRLAKQTLQDILRELRGYGVQEKPTTPLTRSMR